MFRVQATSSDLNIHIAAQGRYQTNQKCKFFTRKCHLLVLVIFHCMVAMVYMDLSTASTCTFAQPQYFRARSSVDSATRIPQLNTRFGNWRAGVRNWTSLDSATSPPIATGGKLIPQLGLTASATSSGSFGDCRCELRQLRRQQLAHPK